MVNNFAPFIATLAGVILLAPKVLPAPSQQPLLTLLFLVCVVLTVLNAKRLFRGGGRGPGGPG